MNSKNKNHIAKESADKLPLIAEVISLFEKIGQRMQEEDDEERHWLLEHCKNPVLEALLKDMTVMELHVLDAIGQLEPVNGITISKQFKIPRGSVSKITRRLIKRGLVRTEFLPKNKKEILFCTTPLGKDLFKLHQALHRQIEKGVTQFLQKYTYDELNVIVRMLKDSLETSWVNFSPKCSLENSKQDK
ncbi:MarR family transcriptional regulator [Brevibacillus borstelensis]|uniref:MarR family transcriptional regulator n=1 Tax=Brevibacillus borstelensis TaxID=45462 RepID=UPI0030C26DB0